MLILFLCIKTALIYVIHNLNIIVYLKICTLLVLLSKLSKRACFIQIKLLYNTVLVTTYEKKIKLIQNIFLN